jgi:pimeloyl-ACP methyl ester carboxylesterase
MSRRTQTMFRSPAEFERPALTNEIRVARRRVGEPAQGAVAQLMQALDDFIAADPSNHYAITLIGHSMGTIVANEMVLTHPGLAYSNIVYMGAACNVSDFANAVIPCLERNTNAHFYNLTLHPVAEAREAQWTWLDLTPRGSLLEWIDNFLSTPRTVPERTLGKWDNVISTTALIPTNIAGRVRIKAFAVGPRDKFPDNPMIHGDFSEEPFWQDEFWTRRAP